MTEPNPEQRETLYTGVTVPPPADETDFPVPQNAASYDQGPLFSKKVLIGWALATLTVWAAFTMIVPIVKEAVREAVITKLEEPGSNTATKTVIQTRNGLTITKTDKGVTIERRGLPALNPPASVITSPGATPPQAPAAAPAKAPPPAPVSGKR